MQDRLGEAEERLDHLGNWQVELAGKQDEFRAEIQEELARLEAKTDSAAVTSVAASFSTPFCPCSYVIIDSGRWI